MSNPDEYVIDLGHLGWSQHRGGLEVYAGNDPTIPRAARKVLWDAHSEREGATVLVVVLPGRFASGPLVTSCADAIVTALRVKATDA